MHKANVILNTVFAKLEALKTSGIVKEAFKNKAIPQNDSPSIYMLMGADTPQTENSNFIDSQLDIYTDVNLISIDDDVDSQMLEVRTAIHQALLTDHNLGLDFVLKVTPGGQQEPEYDGDNDSYSSATRLVWTVLYRSNYKDPTL